MCTLNKNAWLYDHVPVKEYIASILDWSPMVKEGVKRMKMEIKGN